MSKFTDFLAAQQRPEAPKGEIIDGCFYCQTCDADVEEAEYFRSSKVLQWQCANGHTSFIEDFVI